MTLLRLSGINLYSVETLPYLQVWGFGFVLQNLIEINCHTGELPVKIS